MNKMIEHGIRLQADVQRQVDRIRGGRIGGFTYFTVLEWSGRVDAIYVTCTNRDEALTNASLAERVTGRTHRVWNETLHCFE